MKIKIIYEIYIYLFPETLDLLRKYFNFKPDDKWLFVTKTGEPFLQGDTIRNYHIKPLLNKIGVEYKAVYATRRTYISIMRQSEKIMIEDIQDVVGHKKVQILQISIIILMF